jgi:microcystin-dependent protein
MGQPYLSEIRIFSFNFAPKGWALCNGQTLQINQNQALFALLGTTYGGDGRVTFGLPNLQGRVPAHEGAGWVLGQRLGEESHLVTAPELPAHIHPVQATAQAATASVPTGLTFAKSPGVPYVTGGQAATTPLSPASVTSVGGSQPHENRQPYLTLNICIALQGIFPSQN